MKAFPAYAAVLILGFAFHGSAQQLSIEQRLSQLENEVAELKKENGRLRQELGLEIADRQTAVKPAGKESSLQVGGIIQGQLETGDRTDSRFSSDNDRLYLRRARLNATGKFSEHFDFRVEIDGSTGPAESSGLRAQLVDAFINWNRSESMNVRVGQFKSPFGYEQLYSDPRLLTAERSLVSDRLAQSRQIGLQVGGDLPGKRISYALGAFNGTSINTNSNDNDDFLLAERFSFLLHEAKKSGGDLRITAGINAFQSRDAAVTQASDFLFDASPGTPAPDNLFSGRRKGRGIDAQLVSGPFEVWAEYLVQSFEPDNKLPFAEFDSDGWYVQGSYFLLPARLQLVTRLETFDPNDRIRSDSVDGWTLGANYYLKGNDLKLQLNFLHADSPGIGSNQDRFIARLQTIF